MKLVQLFLAGTKRAPLGFIVRSNRDDITKEEESFGSLVIVPTILDNVFVPIAESGFLSKLFQDQIMEQLLIAAKICTCHTCSGAGNIRPNKNGIFLIINDISEEPSVFYAFGRADLEKTWQMMRKTHGTLAYYFSVSNDDLGESISANVIGITEQFNATLTKYLRVAMKFLNQK